MRAVPTLGNSALKDRGQAAAWPAGGGGGGGRHNSVVGS